MISGAITGSANWWRNRLHLLTDQPISDQFSGFLTPLPPGSAHGCGSLSSSHLCHSHSPHLPRWLHLVESNKALNPVDVAFLGFIGVMPDPKHLTDLIKQLRGRSHARTGVLRSAMLLIVHPYAVRF